MSATTTQKRYFLTYRGVKLLLQLAEELAADGLSNRNTYFVASYDDAGRMLRCEKRVYGDVEMSHVYAYGDDGRLVSACITVGDDEPQWMHF